MRDDQHDSGRVDFSALGPPVAAGRLEALAAATARRAAGELARRARGGGGVIGIVIAWQRPVLAFSALAAAAAILVIAGRPASQAQLATDVRAPATVAEALGIPAAYAYEVEESVPGTPEAKRP